MTLPTITFEVAENERQNERMRSRIIELREGLA